MSVWKNFVGNFVEMLVNKPIRSTKFGTKFATKTRWSGFGTSPICAWPTSIRFTLQAVTHLPGESVWMIRLRKKDKILARGQTRSEQVHAIATGVEHLQAGLLPH